MFISWTSIPNLAIFLFGDKKHRLLPLEALAANKEESSKRILISGSTVYLLNGVCDTKVLIPKQGTTEPTNVLFDFSKKSSFALTVLRKDMMLNKMSDTECRAHKELEYKNKHPF